MKRLIPIAILAGILSLAAAEFGRGTTKGTITVVE